MTGDFQPGWIAHRILIEAPVMTPDGFGGAALSFQPLVSVWAAVTPLRAEALTDADRTSGRITHRLTIRWRDDIKGGMRVRHRQRLFAIDTVVDPDERGRYLVIAAREETA